MGKLNFHVHVKRIVFVCRRRLASQTNIETPWRFGRSVADTVVGLPQVPSEKRKRTLRKAENAAQAVITIRASDLAWLVQRFVFEVQIE